MWILGLKGLRERRDYYKQGDVCCDEMLLQWMLFTHTLSNKANQYFNYLICKSMRKSNGVQLTQVIS